MGAEKKEKKEKKGEKKDKKDKKDKKEKKAEKEAAAGAVAAAPPTEAPTVAEAPAPAPKEASPPREAAKRERSGSKGKAAPRERERSRDRDVRRSSRERRSRDRRDRRSPPRGARRERSRSRDRRDRDRRDRSRDRRDRSRDRDGKDNGNKDKEQSKDKDDQGGLRAAKPPSPKVASGKPPPPPGPIKDIKDLETAPVLEADDDAEGEATAPAAVVTNSALLPLSMSGPILGRIGEEDEADEEDQPAGPSHTAEYPGDADSSDDDDKENPYKQPLPDLIIPGSDGGFTDREKLEFLDPTRQQNKELNARNHQLAREVRRLRKCAQGAKQQTNMKRFQEKANTEAEVKPMVEERERAMKMMLAENAELCAHQYQAARVNHDPTSVMHNWMSLNSLQFPQEDYRQVPISKPEHMGKGKMSEFICVLTLLTPDGRNEEYEGEPAVMKKDAKWNAAKALMMSQFPECETFEAVAARISTEMAERRAHAYQRGQFGGGKGGFGGGGGGFRFRRDRERDGDRW